MPPLLNVEQPSLELVERIGCESRSKPSVVAGIMMIFEIAKDPIGVYFGVLREVEREQNLQLLDPHERMDREIKNEEHKNYFV